MAATYYVDLINTADSYSYRCVYQPLGCDSLRFQMNFSLESFPLYVGGGISVGTLKFIKVDADELRAIFNANALYNLSVKLTNIASGLAWSFFADWSTYTDDGNFVEMGLTITNLREQIKAVNVGDLDLSAVRQFYPITSKPQVTNKLLWQRQIMSYFSTYNSGGDYVDLATENGAFFRQIKDGGTLDVFKFAENQSSHSCELLRYAVPDGNLDADTSVYINITGQLVFTWDNSLYPANPHDFCTDPQIEIRFDSYLVGATSQELLSQTTNVFIVQPPDTTTTMNINWTGVVPVYRSAPLASGQSEIYHVVKVQIRAHCTSIQQTQERSDFILSGNLTIKHNIPLLSQNIGVVTMPDLIGAVDSALPTPIFDANEYHLFLTNYLLTTQFFSAEGTPQINAKLEDLLSAWSKLSAMALVEKEGLIYAKTWANLIADMLDNAHTIQHFYDFKKVASDEVRIGVAMPTRDEITDLNFFVRNYWNNQRFAINNTQTQSKGDISLQHNYIVDGQQIFINLLKQDPTNKDIMMLWRDGADIVTTPTNYPNEYFSARRVVGRLASYIYSRMPTADNLTPVPTPTPQYISTIPTDGGTPVANDSAITQPPLYRFKPYKVTCKMLIERSVIADIITNALFSFELDGKYYYPTSMALGLESDTYEVEMLEFA